MAEWGRRRPCLVLFSSYTPLGPADYPHNPCKNFERKTDCQQSTIQLADEQSTEGDTEMKTLFDTAARLRKAIKKCKKWKFTGY